MIYKLKFNIVASSDKEISSDDKNHIANGLFKQVRYWLERYGMELDITTETLSKVPDCDAVNITNYKEIKVEEIVEENLEQ